MRDEENRTANLTIWADWPITRRTRRHLILDDRGDISYATNSITDAIEHLVEQGAETITIRTGPTAVDIRVLLCYNTPTLPDYLTEA
jgi:hypothetical protein